MLRVRTRNPITLLLIGSVGIFVLAACSGYHTDVRRVKYSQANKPKERTIGVMRITDLSSQEEYEVSLEKIHRGYGISTPLYVDDDSSVRAIVSKGKEHKWFAGVQWKWEF